MGRSKGKGHPRRVCLPLGLKRKCLKYFGNTIRYRKCFYSRESSDAGSHENRHSAKPYFISDRKWNSVLACHTRCPILAKFGLIFLFFVSRILPVVVHHINRLKPNDPYMGRTAPLTSKRCILYIYSTNIGTEYFKHALYSPFFFLFKMQFVS